MAWTGPAELKAQMRRTRKRPSRPSTTPPTPTAPRPRPVQPSSDSDWVPWARKLLCRFPRSRLCGQGWCAVEQSPELAVPAVQVEHSSDFTGPSPVEGHAARPEGVALAVQADSQAGQLGAALVALASLQAAAIAAEARQVEAARHDSRWWRCEALDLRRQLDQVRAQLGAAQVEAAQLRAVVERHQRPTVPLGVLRHLRAG